MKIGNLLNLSKHYEMCGEENVKWSVWDVDDDDDDDDGAYSDVLDIDYLIFVCLPASLCHADKTSVCFEWECA